MAKYYSNEVRGFYRGLGRELEEELIAVFWEHFRKTDRTALKAATTAEDRYQGTDIFIKNIPCDITCDFAGKDHMIELSEEFEIFGFNKVRLGIRTGNSHKGYTKFRTPVLVIGIDGCTDSFLGTWMVNIVESFRKIAGDIWQYGSSQYRTWVRTHSVH